MDIELNRPLLSLYMFNEIMEACLCLVLPSDQPSDV